jgi:curved DNA-binding protein CbpA
VQYKGKTYTYYEMLDIPQTASKRKVKQQFGRLSKIYHPDVYRGPEKERYHHIIKAYSVLSHNEKRAAYDKEIGGAGPTERPESPEGGSDTQEPDPASKWNDLNFGSMGQFDKERMALELDQLRKKEVKTDFEEINVREGYIERQMTSEEKARLKFTQGFNKDLTLQEASQKPIGFKESVAEKVELLNRVANPPKDYGTPAERVRRMAVEYNLDRPKFLVRLGMVFALLTGAFILLLVEHQKRKSARLKAEILDNTRATEQQLAKQIRQRFIFDPSEAIPLPEYN